MKIVVTGAAGHLGSHLASLLVELGQSQSVGFDVIGLDMVAPAAPCAGITYVTANLTDCAQVEEHVSGATLIAHCASIHPWKTYTDDQYLDCNIKGTWSLYSAAASAGVDRIVLTSSIAATGYHNMAANAWPIMEDTQWPLGDLYSLTKHTQEDIARLFAHSGKVRTLAMRPPAFMPAEPLETCFRLTGAFAIVDDIAAAHLAAIKVMLGLQDPGGPLEPFEAFYTTNALPYTAADADLYLPDRSPLRLVRKYWPDAHPWLIEHGYKGGWLPAVYDLSKAKRLLGWEPQFNFEQSYALCRRAAES